VRFSLTQATDGSDNGSLQADLWSKPLFPFTERSRNLVRFCKHAPHEQLHESFSADFGFRDALSHFSILKNYGTLPGPDDCFSHIQMDARPLFEKLIGLEIEYPGTPYPLRPNSSMNYFRSHIEEFFHHTGPQHHPFPPVEGRCLMFFSGTDVLKVEFELVNKSAADVDLRLRWFSVPAQGLGHRILLQPDGFRHECVQQVHREYTASASLSGCVFQQASNRLESAWQDVRLAAHQKRSWEFVVCFNDAMPESARATLAQAIMAVESRYAALPELPVAWKHFEPLALCATGIVLSARYLERDLQGTPVPTVHGGKCGVEALWFWDTATTLLGSGLMKDANVGWGSVRLLCDGISDDGKPFVHYCDGRYIEGVQNPILAWGVWNFHSLCPDRDQLARSYPALQRYVDWWVRNCDATGSGLFIYPAGAGTGLDDALQWQEEFPISLEPGQHWHAKTWGNSRPDRFESVDTNTHLYLEMKALGAMARELGRDADANAWEERAATLGERIHTLLFNAEAGIYQARSIEDGRFNNLVSLESFLPIYAGITPRPLAQQLCRTYLLNPRHFYTTLPFPTLDRSHEAFRSSGSLYEPPEYPGSLVQQAYWIGRTWLNYSYWMVGALNQAGLGHEADAAAQRILEAVSRSESIYECYNPLTGTGTGHAEFPWGAASVLALLFQLYKQPAVPELPDSLHKHGRRFSIA
jgi:Trehalase